MCNTVRLVKCSKLLSGYFDTIAVSYFILRLVRSLALASPRRRHFDVDGERKTKKKNRNQSDPIAHSLSAWLGRRSFTCN